MFLAFLLCCSAPPDKVAPPAPSGAPGSGTPLGPAGGNAGSPPPVSGPGAPTLEDLRPSFSDTLAVEVPALPDASPCPDADRDGYPDARACPATPPDKADCDDRDPKVTPDGERWVRPGPFLMGSNAKAAGRDEGPIHVVTLSGYCVDRLESYRDGRPWEGLTWQEASDSCKLLGKHLPTEAQWEKAARGGCEGGTDPGKCDAGDLHIFAWGDEQPGCDRANHQVEGMPPRLCEGAPSTTVHNSGPYGHVDLSGNVWEWVSDWYHPSVYGDGTPRTNPTGPAAGDVHVLRGGGWNTFSSNMRVSNRFNGLLDGSATGFRCARTLEAGKADAVAPLVVVTLSGSVRGNLVGSALYLTAFDARDADPVTGMVRPGRSPAGEVKLAPNGGEEQAFSLRVPRGGPYILMAALDAGEKVGGAAPSGSGGAGIADGGPVDAQKDVRGIVVTLGATPAGPHVGTP